MQKWILPTLSEVLALSEESRGFGLLFRDKGEKEAERKWRVAIAALENLLLQSIDSTSSSVADNGLPRTQGLVFTGPVPVLSHKALVLSLSTWILRAELLNSSLGMPSQLPPATAMSAANSSCAIDIDTNARTVLPLLAGDPLSTEQFCLVLTAEFSLVMVLGKDLIGNSAFLFSFEPEVVAQAWQVLQARIVLACPDFSSSQLEALVEKYYPVTPDYRTVMQFSRLLLKHLPTVEEVEGQGREREGEKFAPFAPQRQSDATCFNGDATTLSAGKPARSEWLRNAVASQVGEPPQGAGSFSLSKAIHSSTRPDVELLQAFAHEVRTPLTTIRTLTRLLLKRRDLPVEVSKRLKIIDRECTEQIDRMELLFRAAELVETSTVKQSATHLTAISLSQVLQQSIPRWQSSASRRNLTLDVALPQQLPTVVSDPMMLDQVLTGLIENFARSLPAGSHIQVQVIPAGDQLKLQLQGEGSGTVEPLSAPPICKSVGPLLMFQPETGNISLNLTATKHLFQAIGGKLIVRQRPHQGEVLTIFLPLEVQQPNLIDQVLG